MREYPSIGRAIGEAMRRNAERAAETIPDHAAVPCPAPPTERVCDDCREPLDADGCLHNADRPYCSACIGNCAECVADLRDDMAAEAAEEWRLQ